MNPIYSLNLMDIDSLVQNFIKEREQSIATLHRIYFKSGNQVSLRALKESLIDELRTGCVTFLNKEGADIEDLGTYLFYIANAYCKKSAKPEIKQKIEYICPGCVFMGKEYSNLPFNKIFRCDECFASLNEASDPKLIRFFSVFAAHNKNGYHCPDCSRFIPHPLDNSSMVSCPYFDCFFVGAVGNLNKMHHPTSKSNPEKLILDLPLDGGLSLKDNVLSREVDAHIKLEMTDELQDKLKFLQEIIETQSNNVPYSSLDATVRHKQYVYQAILNLLEEFPAEMIAYLSLKSDSYMGFQHKIFQEYIRLLEESFPFIINKNNKIYKISNLLDKELCLFDGISVFDAVVSDKLIVKNGTKEFYIGGRKAAYARPYYIGKILNIIHQNTKKPLTHLVKNYSFSKIYMQDIAPGTPITVTHLRVPPHYQMGGMSYVNRVRKKIVERVKNRLNARH